MIDCSHLTGNELTARMYFALAMDRNKRGIDKKAKIILRDRLTGEMIESESPMYLFMYASAPSPYKISIDWGPNPDLEEVRRIVDMFSRPRHDKFMYY